MQLSQKPLVLLVEDNALAIKMGKIILEELNCEVDVAENGRSALEKIIHHTYNIIIIDIGLPDIDGLCVIEAVRHGNSTNQMVPIVVLTAQTDEQYKQGAEDRGASGYFLKPLTLESAALILERYIKY